MGTPLRGPCNFHLQDVKVSSCGVAVAAASSSSVCAASLRLPHDIRKKDTILLWAVVARPFICQTKKVNSCVRRILWSLRSSVLFDGRLIRTTSLAVIASVSSSISHRDQAFQPPNAPSLTVHSKKKSSMSDTAGKPIQCKAMVARGVKQMAEETITVDPPKEGEGV